MKSKRIQRRSYVFLLLSTCIVLLGGVLTMLWQMEHREASNADAGNVVGAPTLPAATVDSILSAMGSPMTGTGSVIEQAARNTNIDDAFALAVWWTETNDGEAGVGSSDRNPGGVRSSAGYPVDGGAYTIYPSYAAAIDDWFSVVANRYVSRGLTSVYTISHPYVGTSTSDLWANKVVALMDRYHAEAPPTPTPTPTPSPTPTPLPSHFKTHLTQVGEDHPGTPAAAQATSAAAGQQAMLSPVLSASSQQYLLGLALLAAALIAVYGVVVRRRMPEPVVAPATAPLALDVVNPLSNMAPIYINQYSPVVELDTAPLLVVPKPEMVPPTPIFPPTPSQGGLLTRYSSASMRPRRVVLQQTHEDAWSLASTSEHEAQRNTEEFVPNWRSLSLPGRVPEPVKTSSGGLLRRYGDMAEKKEG